MPRPLLPPLPFLLVLVALLALPACGGGSGDRQPVPGTVALLNQSDQGMAPVTIEQFFLEPVGASGNSGDRLSATVEPGGVVIVGLFPAGLYNAVAVLDTGGSIVWNDEEIFAGQPKNFIVP